MVLTPAAAAALPLADLVDSALVLRVAAPGFGRMLWAGRLAAPSRVAGLLNRQTTLWWADELAEALVACGPGSASAAAGLFDEAPAPLLAIDRAKRMFAEGTTGGVVDLSPAARVVLFGEGPSMAREEIERLWAGWGAGERRGYKARRAWALGRVPDTERDRLVVAAYAAARTEIARRRTLQRGGEAERGGW